MLLLSYVQLYCISLSMLWWWKHSCDNNSQYFAPA